ncbi:hypothetical protein [Deinococcus roseus]|uniref:Uncharacterized protein n=1 Tax=Deinococcus roseus TaxID=392414 RepID=A0ABQ2D342_9DEIO|nr:hypothetical protein [Deinococcus roseus]GGJ44037.1 hypothetical protein GCM10008938_32890 [Deinococcus roseus]
MTDPTLHQKLLALPPGSPEMVKLGDALSATQLKTLKDHGIPIRWSPMGPTYTLIEFEQEARHHLTP